MSHQQDANDAKLATAEQENAAVLARLSKMEAELKNLKEKTLLLKLSVLLYTVWQARWYLICHSARREG